MPAEVRTQLGHVVPHRAGCYSGLVACVIPDPDPQWTRAHLGWSLNMLDQMPAWQRSTVL